MKRSVTVGLVSTLLLIAGLMVSTGTALAGLSPGINGSSLNLLTNGDAETGDLTGWTPTHFTVDGSSPLSGSYSFAADLGNWNSNSWIYQSVDVSQYANAIDAGGVQVVVLGSTTIGSPISGSNIQCSTSFSLESQTEEIAFPDGNLGLAYDVPVGARTLILLLSARNVDFDHGGIAVSGCEPKWDDVQLILSGLPTCDNWTATHIGTSDPDVITGTDDRDVIVSLGGDDEVHGLAGDDVICLGPGADLAYGGNGGDLIFGEAGRDVIHGGRHRDTIHGGGAKDRIYGDGNQDFLFGDGGHDRIRGGVGDDLALGGDGNDRLIGNGGDDDLTGGGGDNDVAKGKAGIDNCDAEIEFSCELNLG